MAIANFSTEVPVIRTIGEIHSMLVQAGAQAIMTEYANGEPSSVSFRIARKTVLHFRLPAEWKGVQNVLRPAAPRAAGGAQRQAAGGALHREWLMSQKVETGREEKAERKFGQMTFRKSDAVWRLNAEPHVCIRAKRIFPKADNTNPGWLMLTHTPENCADLAWFLQRYPLEIAPVDLRRLRRARSEYEKRVRTFNAIMEGHFDAQPFALALPARHYQLQAAQACLANRFLLLADDVGLGKTASAICVLTDPGTRPALVVTLAHLARQWRDELAKFAPGLRAHIIQVGKPVSSEGRPYRIPKEDGKLPDVLILNYSKLHGWADTLAGKVKSVVFDEIQELRRSDSNKYAAALAVTEKAGLTIGLSATPIYNYGGEMYNVMQVLQRDCLGNEREFNREWCGPYGGIRDPKAFGSFLREKCILLRRTRAEVSREIPPVTQVPHSIDSDASALDLVKGSAAELARIILSEKSAGRGDRFEASGQFDMLVRQATGIAKAPYVADFVRLLVENGERVVLYGWHRQVYDLWLQKLAGLNPLLYTGSESAAAKDHAKKEFVEGRCNVLIISLRAGAGLDGLQYVSRTCVFGELDWSPGVHEQCIGRIARDGQVDPVTAYFLLAEDGSDPIMADVLGLKKAQIEGIRDPNAEIIERVATTGDHVKKLAADFMARLNRPAPAEDAA